MEDYIVVDLTGPFIMRMNKEHNFWDELAEANKDRESDTLIIPVNEHMMGVY